jgi:hypothetical protein
VAVGGVPVRIASVSLHPPPGGSIDEPQSARRRCRPADARGAAAAASVLEAKYPGVLALLQRVWGRPEAARAFETLILSRDGGVRRWPRDAWTEIALLRSIHGHLNERAPDGDAPVQGRPSELELGYRRVLKRMEDCWGDVDAFGEVFADLITDRRGDRSGWPMPVWTELVFLQEVHDLAHGVPVSVRRFVDARKPDAATAPRHLRSDATE